MPVRLDGVAATFEVRDCRDAIDAYEQAEVMLTTHHSASAIEVRDGERLVFTVKRQTLAP